ncbi:MAG: hypothetical protein M1818_000264 [Claussenomyces sp. TS43310]|nr:MAG: hypothetical protein M1818_000264 [Claussenomyces sp. TS43310]
MDSMRSLNTSLPGTSPPKHQSSEPPEQLLQAFKAAALSVTKLYKTAAFDQTRARSEGYQDALDDLLAFLDKEDIGLSDGEGWKIRRWATERLDGRDAQNTESDEEREHQERSSSPVIQRAQSTLHVPTRAASPVRMDIAAPTASSIVPTPILEQPSSTFPPTSTFTFRSSHAYPQDSDTNVSDPDLSDGGRGQPVESSMLSHGAHTPTPSITISRPGRPGARHNTQAGRHNTRTSGTIGRGAGQKRKINLGEFFDIGNLGLGYPKDAFGGSSKRGRFA